MKRAEQADAVNKQKFFFRQFLSPPDISDPEIAEICSHCPVSEECDPDAVCAICTMNLSALCEAIHLLNQPWMCGLSAEDGFEEMTLNEIMNGKDSYFPGLIPLIYGYMDFIKCEYETFTKLDQYLTFISLYVFC